MQAKIKDLTRKMMALVSELSMNQVIFCHAFRIEPFYVKSLILFVHYVVR